MSTISEGCLDADQQVRGESSTGCLSVDWQARGELVGLFKCKLARQGRGLTGGGGGGLDFGGGLGDVETGSP